MRHLLSLRIVNQDNFKLRFQIYERTLNHIVREERN